MGGELARSAGEAAAARGGARSSGAAFAAVDDPSHGAGFRVKGAGFIDDPLHVAPVAAIEKVA